MKITRVEAIPICVPLKKGMTARTAHGEHVVSDYVVLRVHTDEGLVGLGEATLAPRWTGETAAGCIAAIEGILGPALAGHDPTRIAALRRRLDRELKLNPFTKAAVAMLTMTAALEAGEHGIRINAIAPGATLTPFTTWRLHRPDGTLDQEAYDAFVEQSKEQSPLRTLGEPVDQALLIQYLVSDASRFATGNIFRVNGGQTMAW